MGDGAAPQRDGKGSSRAFARPSPGGIGRAVSTADPFGVRTDITAGRRRCGWRSCVRLNQICVQAAVSKGNGWSGPIAEKPVRVPTFFLALLLRSSITPRGLQSPSGSCTTPSLLRKAQTLG